MTFGETKKGGEPAPDDFKDEWGLKIFCHFPNNEYERYTNNSDNTNKRGKISVGNVEDVDKNAANDGKHDKKDNTEEDPSNSLLELN